MSESPCHVCGSDTTVDGMAYQCAYCGEPVCPDHRLPENHRCTGERLADDDSPHDREAKPLRLSEEQTVGTTPTETGQSSPDVALDGSVVGADSDVEEASSQPWWRRFLPW